MATSIARVLVKPARFYSEKKVEQESLRVPVLIVLVLGAVSAAAAYLMAGLTMQLLPGDMQSFAAIAGAAGAAGALIAAFLTWAVIAAVFFGISAFFGGQGSFRRTLEFVGYGFVPQIIGGIVSLILIFSFVSGVQVAPVTDPLEVQRAVGQLMQSPLLLLSSLVGILFLAWSANIWIFAVQHARSLTTRNAAITVILPVAVYIAFSLLTLGLF
ncbi:MAG: Yip1 family protein [Methanomicrobiales archaeon]|nr:Yip1 family protein [Methanomicrobiales archaeon]MDI6876624.1 Yip1 family protein [Methanomicrobiales archaeon]